MEKAFHQYIYCYLTRPVLDTRSLIASYKYQNYVIMVVYLQLDVVTF